jgi:hypothetical protein
MPEYLRKLVGVVLLLTAIGIASWQSLLVSCSSSAQAGALPASPPAHDRVAS